MKSRNDAENSAPSSPKEDNEAQREFPPDHFTDPVITAKSTGKLGPHYLALQAHGL